MYYGLINRNHLDDIAEAVCDSLGYGSNENANILLIETAGAETNMGNLKDPSIYAGMGITQFDKMPFYDIKTRTRHSDKTKILFDFDIVIDLVEWEDLRYNPLLSLIFTRLKYKLIPDVIPATLELRADYWKKHYNTKAGKGTVEHYMSANKR